MVVVRAMLLSGVCDELGENSNGKGGRVEVVHPTLRDKAAQDGAPGG
jgi:hypothetical protein